MTEAEKQAIDNFKFFNEGDYITREMAKSKDIVLNLIERQQKEIENAYWKGYTARDTKAQNICKSCKYRTKEIKDLQTEIERQKDMYRHLSRDSKKAVDYTFELNKEIEKQDKIIDEMTYYLSDFDIDEMCEQCECCIGNGCHADDDVEFKMRCIKEYFKKKVQKT